MKDNININFDFGCNENSSCLKGQLDSRPQDIGLMYKLANSFGNIFSRLVFSINTIMNCIFFLVFVTINWELNGVRISIGGNQ